MNEIKYEHVMLDLETMGLRSDAAIVAIGATAFDFVTKTLGPSFYAPVDLKSSVDMGGTMDPSTIGFWLHQSKEAIDTTFPKGAQSLGQALHEFAGYLTQFGSNVRVWGNGSDFDNVILCNAYLRSNQGMPWKFFNNRCFRTLKEGQEHVTKPVRKGIHHNALDDAIHQAEHAVLLRSR